MTSWEQPVSVNLTAKWSFKDDKYTLEMVNNLEEGTIKLEPGKKPATIDLIDHGRQLQGQGPTRHLQNRRRHDHLLLRLAGHHGPPDRIQIQGGRPHHPDHHQAREKGRLNPIG